MLYVIEHKNVIENNMAIKSRSRYKTECSGGCA